MTNFLTNVLELTFRVRSPNRAKAAEEKNI